MQTKALELPKEHEMPARDKYTVFSPHARGYRKGVHKVPKFTRVRSSTLPILECLISFLLIVNVTEESLGILVIVFAFGHNWRLHMRGDVQCHELS